MNSVPASASPTSAISSPKRGVGPVRAVAQHRLVVGQPRPRRRRGDGEAGGLEHARHQPLDDTDHVVLLDERHLEVELRELGLAVGPQVLVAEAAGDLVVALEAGHHQQLLEQLRRLRQRVEVAGAASGSGRGSRARPRASSASASASRSRGSRARRGSRGSPATTVWRSSMVSRIRSRRRSITRWRRRSVSSTGPSSSTGNGGVADSASSSTAATAISISPVARFGLTLPGSRRTTSPDAEITCSGRSRSAAACASAADSGWNDELHQPGAVAQVDEDQPAVVAAAVDPAGDADGLADARGAELARTRRRGSRWRAALS